MYKGAKIGPTHDSDNLEIFFSKINKVTHSFVDMIHLLVISSTFLNESSKPGIFDLAHNWSDFHQIRSPHLAKMYLLKKIYYVLFGANLALIGVKSDIPIQ